MDLYVKPGFGIEGLQLEHSGDREEPKAIVHLEAQGGLKVRVHLEAPEWRWLAVMLEQKRQEENTRLGIERPGPHLDV